MAAKVKNPALTYPDELSLRAARGLYFDNSGFGENTYTSDRWVRVDLGPVPLYFPNTAGRKAIVPIHDLHHILNNYPTTFFGECQIGAWELASGCFSRWIAWVLNNGSFLFGFFIDRRELYRCYRRGQASKNLYGAAYDPGILERSVGDVRRELGLSGFALAADTPALRRRFARQAVIALFVTLLATAAYFLPIVALTALAYQAVGA